jgi:hypothetical protein
MANIYFKQNLKLTHDFFQNNVSNNLSMKISETYKTFAVGEQGGPLFFVLMMNHLLSDTEEADISLNNCVVKKFDIKTVKGENIFRVVSLLRGAVKRLQHINKMPEDIVRTLLNVIDLWPMALNHSVYIWNNLPKCGAHMAPIELFTGMKFPNYNHLQRSHVWGCPVYVLDPRLQDGKNIPKWKPRARRRFYIGVSKQHSATVGRLLNLNTSFISDQYHCVYDNLFSSIPCPIGNPFDPETFSQPNWAKIIESGYERHVPIDYDHHGRPIPLHLLGNEWLSRPERLLRTQISRQRYERRHLQRHHTPTLQRELALTLQRELQPQLQRDLHPQLQRELNPTLQIQLHPQLRR